MVESFFIGMPRGSVTKDLIVCEILKLKRDLDYDTIGEWESPKGVAHKYLNKILDKLDEFRA